MYKTENIRRARVVLVLTLTLSIAIAALTLFMPEPPHLSSINAEEFRGALLFATFFACLHVSAAVLFIAGLGVFKQVLKYAYKIICVGIALQGLALITSPVIIALDVVDQAWVQWLAMPVYVPAGLLVYLGLRIFAKALHEEGWWLRPVIVIPGALAIGIVGQLLSTGDADPQLYSILAFGAINIYMALRIKRTTGPAYTNAMAWLTVALVMSFTAALVPTLYAVLHISENSVLAIPFILSGIAYVKAGYAFNKIGDF